MIAARPLSLALTTTLAALAAPVALPAPADAKSIVITSCGESPAGQTGGWTVSPGTASMDAGTECPPVLDHGGPTNNRSKHTGLYLTDKLGTVDTPAGTERSVTFTVAPGTTLTRAQVWRYYSQADEPNWRLRGETLEGQLLDFCEVVENIGCNFGGRSYIPSSPENGSAFVDFPGLSTAGLRYRLKCEAPSGSTCVSGSSLHRVSLSLFGLKLTIDDPDVPSVAVPSGALWSASGYQEGTLGLSAGAQDTTGISELRLLIDGQVAQSVAGSCSYTRPVPCGSLSGTPFSVSALSLDDGPHTVAVEALDAAGNAARQTRPSPLLVDTQAPAAPVGVEAATGSSTSSSSNAFALRWALPADAGSPIVRARTTVCPAGQSTSCLTPREAESVTSSGTFAVPEPGEWDVRVVLEDELGHTDPARAATVRVSYRPVTTPAPTPLPPTTTPQPSVAPATPSAPSGTSTLPGGQAVAPGGPLPSPLPGSEEASGPSRLSALLRGSRVTRSGSVLRVRGKRRSSATGRVSVEVSGRIAERTLRVTRKVSVRRGRFMVRIRLRGRLATVTRPRVRLIYAGDARVRSARVTLRAPGPRRPAR